MTECLKDGRKVFPRKSSLQKPIDREFQQKKKRFVVLIKRIEIPLFRMTSGSVWCVENL